MLANQCAFERAVRGSNSVRNSTYAGASNAISGPFRKIAVSKNAYASHMTEFVAGNPKPTARQMAAATTLHSAPDHRNRRS